MAKIFRSIERELITYMYLKKNQFYNTSSSGIFVWEDEIKINNNLKFILKIEFDDEGQLSEHILSLHPLILDSKKYYLAFDILVFKILFNKIKDVYLCDYSKYDDYEFNSNILSNRNKQDLEDLKLYFGICLGMGYPEIKEFEKKLKLFNVSYI